MASTIADDLIVPIGLAVLFEDILAAAEFAVHAGIFYIGPMKAAIMTGEWVSS